MIPRLFDSGHDRLETLAQIHGTSFPDPWSAMSINDLLTGPGTFAFQLQDGFILARVAGGEAEILTLAVAPAMRGQGLGRVLLAAAASHAQTLGATNMFLEVGVDNPPALALYAGQGFVRVGRRKAYYGGGDALIMKAQLPLSKNSDIA
jgi:ribosomal-protein-alanine N-acetyltransferase